MSVEYVVFSNVWVDQSRTPYTGMVIRRMNLRTSASTRKDTFAIAMDSPQAD